MSQLATNNLLNEKDQKIAQLEQALALEVALEKVRASTMRMQKSEELADVASLVFQQLKALKVVGEEDRFHFSIHDEKMGITHVWITEPNGQKIVKGFDFPLTQLPPLVQKNYERWKNTPKFKRKELLENTIYKGKDLDDFLALLLANPIFAKEKSTQALLKNKPDQLVQNGANFSHGVLVVTITRQLKEKELKILQRFAIVFEQTYTRFLDLQKAEKQAKEAKIEAALERVRARSMAMHKSEELHEIVMVVHQQLKQIGLNFTTSNIGLPDDVTTDHLDWKVWAALDDTQYPTLMHIPYNGNFTIMKEFSMARKSGHSFFTHQLDKKETRRFWKYFFLHHPIEESRQKEVLQSLGLNLSAALLKHTILAVLRYSPTPFTPEENKIIGRFGKVFEQTYTRFLDLQKAETQAREAQIEAALERVRAASMAMHKSEDLSTVTLVLFNQLKALALDFIQSWISIYDLDQQISKMWFSPLEGITTESFYAQLAIPGNPISEAVVDKWQSKVPFSYQSYFGEDVKAFMNAATQWTGMSYFQEFITKKTLQSLHITDAFHQFGNLAVATEMELGTAEKEILQRFSKVFVQAYTRFLDIQKAEAQAREAQIEAALERVRAASMAMHKSEELTNVIAIITDEIEHLGITNLGTSISIIDSEKETFISYVSDKRAEDGSRYVFKTPETSVNSTRILREVFELLQKDDGFFSLQISSDNLQEFVEQNKRQLSEITEIHEHSDHSINGNLYVNGVRCHGFSGITCTTYEPLSVEQKDIFKRLTSVFSMSYRRFLDLKKAETQARKAQIEAALERVRAASMAMHKSDELRQVVTVLFNQIQELEIEVTNAHLSIFNLEEHYIETWFSPVRGIQEEAFYGKHSSIPWEEITLRDWKEGKDFSYISIIGKKAVMQHVEDMQSLMKTDVFVEAVKQLKLERIEGTEANHKYGNVGISQNRKATEEEKNILKRFAKVFEQTYTRFLDIQKAEQQKIQLEKVFSENQRLLHSILPEQIAEQIRQGQQTVVKRFEQVSILFADIVGFTVLSEKLSPQEVVDILNGLFSKFDDLTDKYGLEKIKTIGDAYMVAAGVPEEKDNHAQLMFAFAKEMLQTLKAFNQIIGTDLKIRIGISSGPVVAGVIGKKKFAYDLWGNTVNTAARMEAYGHADCIQVSPTTYRILKKEAVFEKIPNVEIKGKGTMDVYLWTPRFTG